MGPITDRCAALIDGRWTATEEGWPVVSPASGEIVGMIGAASKPMFAAAVDAAARAMAEAPAAHERADALERLAAAVETHAEILVDLLASEAAKPVKLARVEVDRACSTLRLSAVEARKLTGHVVPMDATSAGAGRIAYTLRMPVGVVAAITPFNFPLNLACHKLGPAIAAGCSVVLKPADKAPLTACLLAELAADVGLPHGWVNLVVGDPASFVDVVASDARVGLITFTGSSKTGWALRARAAHKPVTLELGNVTPVIVDETADVANIAERIARSAFSFAGQSCISTQRVYVHRHIANEFEDAFVAAAESLVTGDPHDAGTDVGAIITADAAERVVGMADQAQRGGARRLTGGSRQAQLVSPTVLAGSPAGCDLLTREAFGPIVSVERYRELDDAIAACNSTDFGLQAGVFTQQLDRALRASQTLDFAGITINEVPSFRADQMPYGGVKASGNTREGPAYAVREMTYERLVSLQPA